MPDSPVDTEMDDKVRAIAAGDNIDSRFARVLLADGQVTVREVKTWLAESDRIETLEAQAIEARRAETHGGSVHESEAPK